MARNKSFDPTAMDQAAHDALSELREDMTGKQVAEWIAKYTMSAGYKRLCRNLIAFFGCTYAKKQ
jgi:hypothetical protein